MIGSLDAWKASRKQPETRESKDTLMRYRYGGPETLGHKGDKEMMQTREIRLFVLVAVLLAVAGLVIPLAVPARACA